MSEKQRWLLAMKVERVRKIRVLVGVSVKLQATKFPWDLKAEASLDKLES